MPDPTSEAHAFDDADARTLLSSAAEIPDGAHRHLPRHRTLLIAAIIGLALIWLAPTIAATVSAIDLSSLEHPYRVIFGFVVFDAVIPIFPSESLLTTASNLAAQTDSNIELWRVIVAGSLGGHRRRLAAVLAVEDRVAPIVR